MKWHQDSSYYPQTEEKRDVGALTDVNKHNGTVQVIPDSHKVSEIKVPSEVFGSDSSE